jgi:hypothetical protein
MSRCGWESLKEFFQEARAEEDAVPGGAVAIQSFGDFLGFNPHLQILGTDGCFYGDDMFRVAPRFETKHLEETCPPSLSLRGGGRVFRHKVLKMLARLWRAPFQG